MPTLPKSLFGSRRPASCVVPDEHPLTQNLPVVDSEDSIILVVNQQDIINGKKQDGTCCALSNTFERAFQSAYTKIMKTRVEVCIPDEKGHYSQITRFTISPRTQQFIKDFDAGRTVQPGRYTLSAPRPSEKLNSETKAARSKKAAANRKAGKSKKQSKRSKKKILDTTTRSYVGRNKHKWKAGKVASSKK